VDKFLLTSIDMAKTKRQEPQLPIKLPTS
jgi:hypothetical protein